MASVADAEAPRAAEPAFSLGYRRWMLVLLVSIYACSFLDRVIVSTIGPAIIRDLKLSDLQFGLLGGAAFAVFYALFGLPIARLAERSSRIAIIATCIALWSAMTALSGFAGSYWQLLALRMGVGVGEGGCSPAAHSLLSDHYPPRQRATALAIYSAGVPIGTLLGAVLGGWIAQTFSWRIAFVVVGLPGLALALLARLTLKEPRRGHIDGTTPDAAAPPLGAVVARLFRTPSFRHLAAGFVLANLTGSGVNVFMSTYLVRSFHLGLATVGVLYGLVVGVAGLSGTLAGGLIADWGGKRDARWYALAPGLGALFAFPCYVAAFTRQDAISTIACFFVGGLLITFYLAPTLGVVQNLVEPRMRASAAALMFILINIFGQGLGPTAMGAASDFLARRVLAPGGDLTVCGDSAPAFVAQACRTPQVSGLQAAILAMTVFVLWGSVHFLLAARTIRKDLAGARG
jgi:predicted MFS family arabinose efflux permease